uniref:WGS project CAEQ00000000 data, annotated contig 1888 n=1 Tax=Trypanosoma congolense (strain IL3000) TaxID=1068625 RepID=F9W9R0_TRYCI|nr:unnamed protein product [Trypanosoma congolense IL3000]
MKTTPMHKTQTQQKKAGHCDGSRRRVLDSLKEQPTRQLNSVFNNYHKCMEKKKSNSEEMRKKTTEKTFDTSSSLSLPPSHRCKRKVPLLFPKKKKCALSYICASLRARIHVSAYLSPSICVCVCACVCVQGLRSATSLQFCLPYSPISSPPLPPIRIVRCFDLFCAHFAFI